MLNKWAARALHYGGYHIPWGHRSYPHKSFSPLKQEIPDSGPITSFRRQNNGLPGCPCPDLEAVDMVACTAEGTLWVITVRTLRWSYHLGLFRWAPRGHKGPYKGRKETGLFETEQEM